MATTDHKAVTDVLPLATTDYTEDGQTTSPKLVNPSALLSLFLIFFVIVGNLVVMLCVYIEKRLHKATYLYVVSLAVADTIVALFVMTGVMAMSMYGGLWPLSEGLCVVMLIAAFGLGSVSILHLYLLAHDRYLAVTTPLQYKNSPRKKQVPWLIGVAWIIGNLILVYILFRII